MQAALAQQQAGKLKAAEILYRQALGLSPDDPDCLHKLSAMCYQDGRYVEAIVLILRALQSTGWSVDAMRQHLELVIRCVATDDSMDPVLAEDDQRAFSLRRFFDAPVPAEEVRPMPRARVLVADVGLPRPDHDSGSVRMTAILRMLVDIGCAVTFLPRHVRPGEHCDEWMREQGIEVFCPPPPLGLAHMLSVYGGDFDLIFISRYNVALPYIALLRRYAPAALFVLDTVDLHYLREWRAAEITGDPDTLRQAALTRGQELGVIRSADVTMVVSETEKALLSKELPEATVEVLSNIHDVRGRQTAFESRRDIFFLGSYRHPPNVDAVDWYVKEVWPFVRKGLPEARTHLIGSDMPDSVKALAADGIVAVGYVPELASFLDGCRVAIAPLRYGAGVKGKINMAQGSGVPVVATTLAAEGMHLEHGRDVLVADSAAGFADAVVQLYRDRELWTRLSDGGLANVARYFSRRTARSVLEPLVDLALTRRRTIAQEQKARTTTMPLRPKPARACLVLLPAAYGSLGDEAMVRGFIAQLQTQGAGYQVDLLSIYGGERWPKLPGVRSVVTFAPGDVGAEPGVLERVAAILHRYDSFALLGADVLDGYYSLEESRHRLSVVDMAARQGLDTGILGFSVNDSPEDAAIADLAALSHRVRLCVRDPVSLGRLASRGVGNLIRVADVAFLMPPAERSFATERAERWIEAQRSAGRSVLVFNFSIQTLTEAKRLGTPVLQQLADLIETLISTRRSSVLFLPHDLRAHGTTEDNDVAIAVALSRLLSETLVGHPNHAVAVPTSAAEAKRLAGLADWVITGRLHLAIAAWGMGKPVIGISYQGKFEGLAQDLGMSSCLVDARTFDAQRLAETCFEMLRQIEEVAAAVRARLPHVVEMAGMNLSMWPRAATPVARASAPAARATSHWRQ